MKIGAFDLEKDGIYIIAELSANHNGKLQNALNSIKAAKEIGADYVISKFNLNSDDLVLKCKKCRNNLYLYKIE